MRSLPSLTVLGVFNANTKTTKRKCRLSSFIRKKNSFYFVLFFCNWQLYSSLFHSKTPVFDPKTKKTSFDYFLALVSKAPLFDSLHDLCRLFSQSQHTHTEFPENQNQGEGDVFLGRHQVPSVQINLNPHANTNERT